MCKILAKTKDMTREEWLTLRKQGIGRCRSSVRIESVCESDGCLYG